MKTKLERLEELENKILYSFFRASFPNLLISDVAKGHLSEKEHKEYIKLREEV